MKFIDCGRTVVNMDNVLYFTKTKWYDNNFILDFKFEGETSGVVGTEKEVDAWIERIKIFLESDARLLKL